MKEIVEKEIGGDGAKAGLYIDKDSLSIKISYPTQKVVEPLTKVIDNLVDKIEQFIPGDQTGMAEKLKQEAREEIAEYLADQLAD